MPTAVLNCFIYSLQILVNSTLKSCSKSLFAYRFTNKILSLNYVKS